VEYVEPNYVVHAVETNPNDYYYGLLWGLRNTGQNAGTPDADIDASEAWDITIGSPSVVVGVVDTGIDFNHPDLAANVWSAPANFQVEIYDSIYGKKTISCLQGSHGYNAITGSCIPQDDNNHGSHVSGTIGAVGSNGVGVAGVNWQVKIMGLKFLNSLGSGYLTDGIEAIDFAIKTKQAFASTNGANVLVLSNSWAGGDFTQSLYDEIMAANGAGILFVAAAGNSAANNDNAPVYPASYGDPQHGAAPNVIAVAATDKNDNLATFSNYGARSVDMGAPGVDIYSTIRTTKGSYAYMSGTSMATPHVSGAAALVMSKCPTLNPAQLKTKILESVDKIASLNSQVSSNGRLNVYNALYACSGPQTPDFSLSATPSSLTIALGGTGTSAITVSTLNGFAEPVTLTSSVTPSGPSAILSSATVTPTGTSTLTVETGAALAGSYTVTITGTSTSNKVHTITIPVTIGTPGFTITASPASRTVYRGFTTATYTVTVTRLSGFTGKVDLSVSIPPNSGISGTFNPNPITNPGTSSTFTVRAKSSTPPAVYTLSISGTSNGITKSTTVNLDVRKLFGILGRATEESSVQDGS
jgi:subtilisin family serine protease